MGRWKRLLVTAGMLVVLGAGLVWFGTRNNGTPAVPRRHPSPCVVHPRVCQPAGSATIAEYEAARREAGRLTPQEYEAYVREVKR